MEKKLLCAALALVCLCGAAASGQQSAPRPRRGGGGLDNLSLPSTMERADTTDLWKTFAPQGESFSVEMPGTPVDVADQRRAGSRAGADAHSYRVKFEEIEYEVTRTQQIPEAMFEMTGFREDFLDSLSGSLPAAARKEWPHMNLRLVGQRAAALDGEVGREFDLASEGYRSRVRAFIVNRSLLIVAMTGAKTAFKEERAEKYFGSLRLTRQ